MTVVEKLICPLCFERVEWLGHYIREARELCEDCLEALESSEQSTRIDKIMDAAWERNGNAVYA